MSAYSSNRRLKHTSDCQVPCGMSCSIKDMRMTISAWSPTNNAATNWRFGLPFLPHRDMCINLDDEGESDESFSLRPRVRLGRGWGEIDPRCGDGHRKSG